MKEPSNERVQLEYSLIGSMIQDQTSAGILFQTLTPEDFSQEALGRLFAAGRRVFNDGHPVSRLAVINEFGDDSVSQMVDPAISLAIPQAQVEFYGNMLRERARDDRVHELASTIPYLYGEELQNAVEKLSSLQASRGEKKGISMEAAMQRFFDRHGTIETPDYLKTGLPPLDDMLYIERGDLIIIAGEPSAGKTAFAVQLATHLAKVKNVGFFSFETSPDKLTDRIVAMTAQVPLPAIKKNKLTEQDWKRVTNAAEAATQFHITQWSAAGMTVADMRSISAANRYDVCIIDYLQIIRSSRELKSRYEAVTQISMDLHTWAQATGTTLIVLSQLSRPETEKGKKTPPNMHDLRESGQIENDADAILILYLEDPNDYKGRRILKVAKNKEGQRGTVTLSFDGSCQRFSLGELEPPKRQTGDAPVRGQQKLEEIDDEDGALPF